MKLMQGRTKKMIDRLLYPLFYKCFASMFKRFMDESHDFITDSVVSKYDPTIEYLYWEISELRSQVRYLTADRGSDLPSIQLTKDKFNYQWDAIPDGEAMLSNPDFRSNLTARICELTGLSKEWFAGKTVLDAGCGQGRFSLGFAELGADVVGIDQSEHGLARAQETLEQTGYGEKCKFIKMDFLHDLPITNKFDLVWSFGVLHHTGDTYGALKRIRPLVKPNGYLFLMLYGEPRWWNPDEFAYRAEYARLRLRAINMSDVQIIDLIKAELPGEDIHGWFDAIAPRINDCYQFEEIVMWLNGLGFTNIRRTIEDVHHHVIAKFDNAT